MSKGPTHQQSGGGVSWGVCVQVLLCGVCGSVGRSRLSGDSHQRRSLELLHVWPPEQLWVTAATGRLAQQTTTLLCQQPRAGFCECDNRLLEKLREIHHS